MAEHSPKRRPSQQPVLMLPCIASIRLYADAEGTHGITLRFENVDKELRCVHNASQYDIQDVLASHEGRRLVGHGYTASCGRSPAQ